MGQELQAFKINRGESAISCNRIKSHNFHQQYLSLDIDIGEAYGYGSNKFGQLALPDNIFYDDFKPIFPKMKIKSIHCGAEHTFIITGTFDLR